MRNFTLENTDPDVVSRHSSKEGTGKRGGMAMLFQSEASNPDRASTRRLGSKTRFETLTDLFSGKSGPSYVLLPGGQAVEQGTELFDACGCWVIDPQVSPYAEKWDMVITTSVIITALWVPCEVAFFPMAEMELGLIFALDRMLDSIFLKDMVLQFMMSYPEERQGTTRWVRDRQRIIKHYLFGWFWIDLLSLVPLDIIVEWTRIMPMQSTRELKVIRLVRLLRLMKVERLVKKWQAAWGISYGQVALMKFAFLTVMAVHWMSCMWGLLALSAELKSEEGAGRTWLRELFRSKELTEEEMLFYTQPRQVYILSLYWAVMTLTSLGYGDIVAENMVEYMFCIFCFAGSGLIWAYVIGSICGIISAMDPLLLQYQQNMDLLNIMMADNNLPEDMRRRLRLYFQESRNLQRKVNQQTVVASLSPGLQGELAMKITHDWLQRVWYFDVLEAEPIIEISKRLKPMIFASQEYLSLNNNSRTLFILVRGVVARSGVILGKNSVIGDDMIITSPFLRATAKPICVTFIEVIYLGNEHLNEVREAFPKADERIRRAQVKWALRRSFVLAAWHRQRQGNLAGPRATGFFLRELPSFTTREAAEAWSEETTPRGSVGAVVTQKRSTAEVRKRRTLGNVATGFAMKPDLGLPTYDRTSIRSPRRNSMATARRSSLNSPNSPNFTQAASSAGAAAGAAAAAAAGEAILETLNDIRQELAEGINRLETRMDRIERRINPNMLA